MKFQGHSDELQWCFNECQWTSMMLWDGTGEFHWTLMRFWWTLMRSQWHSVDYDYISLNSNEPWRCFSEIRWTLIRFHWNWMNLNDISMKFHELKWHYDGIRRTLLICKWSPTNFNVSLTTSQRTSVMLQRMSMNFNDALGRGGRIPMNSNEIPMNFNDIPMTFSWL